MTNKFASQDFVDVAKMIDGVDAVIFMFEISNVESQSHLFQIHETVNRCRRGLPQVVVGSFTENAGTTVTQSHHLSNWCTRRNLQRIIIDADEGENVQEPFLRLATTLLQRFGAGRNAHVA